MKISTDRIITIFICTAAIIFGISVKAMPVYYFKKGKTLLEQQKYVKAYSSLKKAYKLNKNNKDYRYYYLQSLLNLSPNIQVQKEVFDLASGSTDDSTKQIAQDKVSEWRRNIITNYGSTYIEQAPLESGIIRWEYFPLSICILDQSETSLPSYYKNEIKRAFSQWQTSVKFISFKYVETTSDANIIVKIVPLPKSVCDEQECKYVVGYTTPNFKKRILKDMTILLYSTDPNGNFFSDKELYNTVLHEIGHSLGIMGHSYSSEDLMYMAAENSKSIYASYRSSFQYLSSKDINTIKLLYKLVPDITNTEKINSKGLIYPPIILGTSEEVANRKIKEAQNYIKNAPDLAGGYIDLGIAYAQVNKINDAIKSMQKGYELSKNDNEKYLSLYNLTTLYMQKKDFKKAEQCANMAYEISATEEIKELLAQIKIKLSKS